MESKLVRKLITPSCAEWESETSSANPSYWLSFPRILSTMSLCSIRKYYRVVLSLCVPPISSIKDSGRRQGIFIPHRLIQRGISFHKQQLTPLDATNGFTGSRCSNRNQIEITLSIWMLAPCKSFSSKFMKKSCSLLTNRQVAATAFIYICFLYFSSDVKLCTLQSSGSHNTRLRYACCTVYYLYIGLQGLIIQWKTYQVIVDCH